MGESSNSSFPGRRRPLGNSLIYMKKAVLLISFLVSSYGVYALTNAELGAQLATLELDAKKIEANLSSIETGSAQWDKQALLTDLTRITGETVVIKPNILALTPVLEKPPLAVCTPNTPQTKDVACPLGEEGKISQTRISSCPGPTFGGWTTTSNSCKKICTPLPSVTESLSCPSGEQGTKSRTKSSLCPGPTWTDWSITSNCKVTTPAAGAAKVDQGTDSKTTVATTGGGATGAVGPIAPAGSTALPSPLPAADTGAITASPSSPPSDTDMTIPGFLGRLSGVLDSIVPFIIGLTVFIIIWGIFNYVTHAAEEEKRAEARSLIIYGILGVFSMLSIWGFVNILLNTFTLERQIRPGDLPTVPTVVALPPR